MTEYEPQDWRTQNMNPTTQESQVTEQENPAVAKLREAFDVARNAIIDGSELAKQVAELNTSVVALRTEVVSLQHDLEYVRNRNRELDEQVTQVRQARDEAIADASGQRQRADKAESDLSAVLRDSEALRTSLSGMYDRVDAAKRDRDDAEMRALEMEEKLKAAEAKLSKVEGMLREVFSYGYQPEGLDKLHDLKPEQPRTETGQFKPSYEAGSQGTF